ncbi:PQQ-binding-like beta-propeller repeat protein [Bremerella cremea]|uniref:PQQ-binding-like beta-propeller repeat protein n=1 Tax=Bremerella cremea TaxID=1031537 RepID=UPI0031E91C8D
MSSQQPNSEPSQPAEETRPQREPRYLPPPRNLLATIVAIVVALIGFFGRTLGDGVLADVYDVVPILRDQAVCNLMVLIGGFFAIFIPLMWLTFGSAYSRIVRYTPITVIVLGVVMFFVVFEIQGVSGNMIPRFGYRFGLAPDQRLGGLTAEDQEVAADATVKVADDPKAFPQFLGPNRNSEVDGPKLNPDWQANPPEELWRVPIGAGWSGFAALDGRIYTMEQRGDEELVSCYDMETGKPIWGTPIQARHETVMGYVGPRCTPLLLDGKVYALGATGVFRCLDQKSGEIVWQHDLLEMYGVSPDVEGGNIAWGRSQSPLAYEIDGRNVVIIPAGGPDASKPEAMTSIVAFDAATGETVWEGGHHQVSYASPLVAQIDGEDQIISINEATITGHEPTTGKELWSLDWPGSSNGAATCSQVHSLGDNKFFVSKGYTEGAQTFEVKKDGDKFDVEVTWQNQRVLKTKFTNVAIQGNDVFGIDDGILEKVTIGEKRPAWRKRGFGHGQVLLVGDQLLVMGEEGNLALVDTAADKYTELGRIKALSSEVAPTWNPLCIYGDLLLVRNAEEAACYRLATQP